MGARDRQLDSALFGFTRLAILRLLFTHPGRELHYRQIVRALGTGQGAVQRELRNLTRAGILLKLGGRQRTDYRANPDCAIYPELRKLFRKLASKK